MFSGPSNGQTPPPSSRPSAADVARIEGHLTHVLITDTTADGLNVFYDGKTVPTGSFDSLTVNVIAPGEDDGGTLTGVLAYNETGADGTTRTPKSLPVFPGTLEMISGGKRIAITCAEEGSFEGLFLRFGTGDNGIGMQADGVQALRITIASGLVDARLTWAEDGREEDVL